VDENPLRLKRDEEGVLGARRGLEGRCDDDDKAASRLTRSVFWEEMKLDRNRGASKAQGVSKDLSNPNHGDLAKGNIIVVYGFELVVSRGATR
jgi:hypothetical protein